MGGITKHCLATSDQVRKIKSQIKFKLANDLVGNKNGLCKYLSEKKKKKKSRENEIPLLIETGELITKESEKSEV